MKSRRRRSRREKPRTVALVATPLDITAVTRCPPTELSVAYLERTGVTYAVVEVDRFAAGALEFLEQLTPAERRITLAACDGLRNRDIGARYGTSARTVANQLRAVYGKLGVSSRTELVNMLLTGHVEVGPPSK